MGLLHSLANVANQWQDDERCDCVADESSNHQGQRTKDEQDKVHIHSMDFLRYAFGDCVKKSRRLDGLAQRQASGSQDDDGPGKVVEILLGQDTNSKEDDNRHNGNHSHIAKGRLELMTGAPKSDGGETNDRDKPLPNGELFSHCPDRYDSCALARLESEQQQEPDAQNGENADGDDDEEPLPPCWRWLHEAEGHDVLRRSNRRQHAAYVRGQRNAHDDGL